MMPSPIFWFALGTLFGLAVRSWSSRLRLSRHRDSNRTPAPPAPGMRREYLWSPSQMAECGGPCWEAQDPRCCDCGAMWRDAP